MTKQLVIVDMAKKKEANNVLQSSWAAEDIVFYTLEERLSLASLALEVIRTVEIFDMFLECLV